MNTCSFFGKCGGCAYDWAAPDYIDKKLAALVATGLCPTGPAVCTAGGSRRRAEFCFDGRRIGFRAARSRDVVDVDMCPNLLPEINAILPRLKKLPLRGAGEILVTQCDNGLDVNITSSVPYFDAEFAAAARGLPVLRVTWNGRDVVRNDTPRVRFGDAVVDFPPGGFLQPTCDTSDKIRQMVVDAARGRVADLFCGLGNFTFALHADGYDIATPHRTRDLFKNPLTAAQLNKYDTVVMDPPRAGALAQSKNLAKSNVGRVIYVSCNPETFARDARILTSGGYKLTEIVPIDQFVGSSHWEILGIFTRN